MADALEGSTFGTGAWGHPPADWTLGPADVDIWLADVEQHALAIGRLEALLADAEWERVARYRHDRDRRRFVVVRGLLRALLGRYIGQPPRSLRFRYGPHGKPGLTPNGGMVGPHVDIRLDRPDPRLDLRFNVSHSRGRALFAFARGREVGVDLEFRRPLPDADAIAGRFFSSGERAALAALPPEARADAFFSCWARKEAYIKGTGGGMITMLRTFDVSLAPGDPPALLAVPSDPSAVERWSLYDPPPIPGYAAALAVEGRGLALRCFTCGPALLNVMG